MEITLKTKFIIDDKFWEDNYMGDSKIFKNSIQDQINDFTDMICESAQDDFDYDYYNDVEAVSLDEIEIVDNENRDS